MAREAPASRAFLICRSDKWLCALPLENVAETMRPLPVEILPDMPPSVLGVAVIRAQTVAVVDISLLLGTRTAAQSGRYVALRLGATRRVAVAVSEVIGVRNIDSSLLEEVPSLLRETAPDIICTIALLDAALLLVLQTARLVPESLWSGIDAQVAST